MANTTHKSGKSNPHAYKRKRDSKLISTIIIISLIVAFSIVVEHLNSKDPSTWSQVYENPSIIDKATEVSSEELAVYYLDVGQSDCSIICNEGKVLMIDTGVPDEVNTIKGTLQSLGITKIDYLIITHQHDDHMGGAANIINNYDVSNIIMPKLSSINMVTTKSYETLLTAIKERNVHAIAAVPGLSFDLGKAKCTVLAPLSQDENLNNMSAVTKVTFGNNSFLFEGDAEKKVESALLKNGTDVSADVIKIGHHGSKTSSSKNYIKAVSPKMAVISCGRENTYGHPHEATLQTLKNANIDTYITYETGLLTVKSDGNKICIVNNSGVVKTYE